MSGLFEGETCLTWYSSHTSLYIDTNLRIGSRSIVAANSVVTKDIPSYSVYVGNPAKFIKKRFDSDKIKQHSLFLQKIREGKIKLVHDRKPVFEKVKQ